MTDNREQDDEEPGFQDCEMDTVNGPLDGTSGSSRIIGQYKILQRIGEGGMGTVYMAQQDEPFRRRVALKIINQRLESKKMVARFEAERQALALMEHPNIAKVLDAGTSQDNRPYFAMELVKGVPITTYCDKNNLPVSERLGLFVPVCNAVQHAHQKGIIHRDLKPSNVLVALYDGKPVPKVIDFGLAKPIDDQMKLTDKTMFTEFGRIVGTVEYMSPEQAEMNQLDVDTRTDIYSLGVMLYELLTGSTPLTKKTIGENALLKLLEFVRETDPPKPSQRLTSSREDLGAISKQRNIQPNKLKQILRGDLDWVVMKALEKDRTRRYETANEFANDLERYLLQKTVVAKPPSTFYQINKFVRRNLAGCVITVAAFVVFTLLVAQFSIDLGRRERLAELESKTRRAVKAEENARASEEKAKMESSIAKKAENELNATISLILNSSNPLRQGMSSQFLSLHRTKHQQEPDNLVLAITNSLLLEEKSEINPRLLNQLVDSNLAIGQLENANKIQKILTKTFSSRKIKEGAEFGKFELNNGIMEFLRGNFQKARSTLTSSIDNLLSVDLPSDDPNYLAIWRDINNAEIVLALIEFEFENVDECERRLQRIRRGLLSHQYRFYDAIKWVEKNGKDRHRFLIEDMRLQISIAQFLSKSCDIFHRYTNGESILPPVPGLLLLSLNFGLHGQETLAASPIAKIICVELLRVIALRDFSTPIDKQFSGWFGKAYIRLQSKWHVEFQKEIKGSRLLEGFGLIVMAISAKQGHDFDLAIECFEDFEALATELGINRHARYGMVLHQHALARFDKWRNGSRLSSGDLDKARRLLKRAISIQQTELGNNHRRVLLANFWLGKVELAAGAKEDAKGFFTIASKSNNKPLREAAKEELKGMK